VPLSPPDSNAGERGAHLRFMHYGTQITPFGRSSPSFRSGLRATVHIQQESSELSRT